MEPLRDFQFRGVPHRTTATLVPYVDCLVEITEMPFTVVTIADINIANLERVGFGLRNFDLTFVFKVTLRKQSAAPNFDSPCPNMLHMASCTRDCWW